MAYTQFQRSFLFFLLLTLFSFNVWGQLQYENQQIEKINIFIHSPTGSNCDSSIVTSRIQTREGSFFSQSEFDNDLKVLSREFDRVEPQFSIVNDKIHIQLHVWPKPTIRTIVWNGNDKIKSARLQSELDVKSCTVFDRLAFSQAFNKVKMYYLKKGFFEAQMGYDIHFDELTNEVDITINIFEGRCGRIKRIIFEGFDACEEDAILELMLTKTYNIFLSWLNNEGTYNEDMMEQDRLNIINYLQNEGYADAQVCVSIGETPHDNRIVIYIKADKGNLYSINNITFEGNKVFSNERIQDLLSCYEGAPYSPDKIRETIDQLNLLYGRRGFIDAVIDYEVNLKENCSYSLHISIDEGEKYRVGLIKVFGNCSTQTEVILHETLLVPGEVFNSEKLKITEERLANIGYFSNVNVYSVETEDMRNANGERFRDVHIEVEETTTGNFGAFFGFSTVESVFGGVNISEKNFNASGYKRLWRDGYQALRGGGEYTQFSVSIGNRSRSYDFTWAKPHFMDSQWTVGFDLQKSSNRYVSHSYSFDSSSFVLHATYDLNAFVKFGFQYRIKNTYIQLTKKVIEKEESLVENDGSSSRSSSSSSDDYANSTINETMAKSSSSSFSGFPSSFPSKVPSSSGRHEWPSLISESKNDGIISAGGITLNYDSTDNPARPSKGLKSRFEAELAGIGGHYHFSGLAYLNTFYYKTDSKGVLKFRGDFRFLFPLFGQKPSHIPLDERLFLGGDNFVRGYKPYKLGPTFSEKEPRGGFSMQLYSMEYVRRITKRFDGFLFFDAGHLSFDRFSFGSLYSKAHHGNDNRLYLSAGYGIRFQIFEKGPPVTLGVGYPINPERRSQVKRFFFMLGGKF
ncbi:MAG: hypothetical protein BGO10_05470 [Chlamydia sp. 32-24]|nr:MAG: hypothetical protein BGO10_05470 [Chlamydia sp. 32-24]